MSRAHTRIAFLVAVTLATALPARGQEPTPPPAAADSAAVLAKKLANPIANLISVPFQSNWDVGIGANNGSKMVLNIQPVVPFKLSEDWNLISRYIVPVASQFDVTGASTSESGLGDAVVTAFLSPSKGGITWGVGPAFLIPTATDDALGSGKLGIGPSVVALRQSGGWTIGGLANHLVSVAGSEDRGPVNATFVNPFFTYNWKSGAGITLNVEYTHDWENGVDVLVVHFPTFSGVTKFGSQTVSFAISPRFHFAPDTRPAYGVRAAVVLVFPK